MLAVVSDYKIAFDVGGYVNDLIKFYITFFIEELFTTQLRLIFVGVRHDCLMTCLNNYKHYWISWTSSFELFIELELARLQGCQHCIDCKILFMLPISNAFQIFKMPNCFATLSRTRSQRACGDSKKESIFIQMFMTSKLLSSFKKLWV